MNVHDYLTDAAGQAFIRTNKDSIIDASQGFADLIGYSVEEIINKKIIELLSKIRIGPNFDIENIDGKVDYFLFTKSLEVKFIKIQVIEGIGERTYVFTKRENSILDDKFSFVMDLFSENYHGIAIYHMPDITLLKANERYISFMDEPFNSIEYCIGRHIWDFASGFRGSTYEDIWNDIIKTGKKYTIEEYMYVGLNRGITYWRLTLMPILEEQRIKYCIVIAVDVTERVVSRKKIKEQMDIIELRNRQVEAIIENIPGGVYVKYRDGIDSQKSIINYNQLFKLNGLKLLEDNLDSIKCFIPEGVSLPLSDTPAYRALKGEKVKNERIICIQNEMKRILDISSSPVYDEKGNILMSITTAYDVTDLINQKRQIGNQRDQLEAIIQNMSDGLSIFNNDGKYILFNKAAKGMFFPPYNYMAKTGDGFYQGEYFDESGVRIPFERLPANRVKAGERFENMYMQVKFPDKELYISVSGTPIYDENNNFILGVLCSRDISKTVKYEEEIKKQKEMLEAIIENMSDSIIVFNKDHELALLNSEARRIYPHLLSKSLEDVQQEYMHYDMDGTPFDSEDFGSSRGFRGETVRRARAVVKTGDKFRTIEINVTPILDNDKNIESVVISHHDVTEQIENQNQLLNVERERNEALEKAMEMKDEFLSIISHEFRTPLNVISTAIQTLKLVYASEMTEKVNEYIGTIRQNINRQLRLVNNLLDITRANAGRIKLTRKNIDIVFLTRAITESVFEYASHKGISIRFIPEITKKIIGIDDEKYERIILNLLSNAIKFTPGGKSITVILRAVDGKISVEVKDTGIGIPSDKVDLIFERFGQVDSSLSRQAEGTGIGLSLVKKFIEALGGSVSVKSKQGKGSTFTILLPDETVEEVQEEKPIIDLMDNRLIQTTNIEFSDIYLY